MKKVLILCDYFPPYSGPRMGYLVKYLSRLGWESYVVAGELSSRGGFEALTGFAKEVHIIPQKPHRKWNLLHILPFFWPYDYLRGEYDMLKRARSIASQQQIDIVLSSCTFGMFPNNTALRVAKENHLPIIFDIRDLNEQEPHFPFWEKSLEAKLNALRQRLSILSRHRFFMGLRKADALVSISPWHVDWLKQRVNPNCCLIYNGFDPELFQMALPQKTNQFEIVYTGTLGGPKGRDYKFLLTSVMNLHRHGLIDSKFFRVKFYCGKIMSSNPIRDDVVRMGISEYFEFLPFVAASKIPAILRDASILLVLTNKNGFHGIMTTKFFEYLSMNRPILCVTSDEDALEQAIQEVNAGCAARSADEAYKFILEKFSEWKEIGYTKGTVLGDQITRYSRKEQARQFSDLFNETIFRHNRET